MYQCFVFPLDNMHESFSTSIFQSNYEIQEHADPYFHNEQDVDRDSSFYMRCENEDVYSILPSELIQNAILIGETDRRDISNLPHESADESYL